MRGTLLGQYRITDPIGSGGMGAVYAAEHTLLGRAAAVKVLLPDLSKNQEMVTRFFNEARAAAGIRHPCIVEIYDFGWHTDGSAYIVMEYLQGQSLAARLARGGVPLVVSLAIVRQLAGALQAAHDKGIVHRDLKPENVFLLPDPDVVGGVRVKLLDFGIAKLSAQTPSATKTRTGAVMGTPTYMAPEQCRGVAVDHRADLYSLGCILFELCAGRTPFLGEGVGDVLAAHIHIPPPTLASLGASVPSAVEALVQSLLKKDPAQRVQSAEAVGREVERIANNERLDTPSIGPLPTTFTGSPQATTLSAGSMSSQVRAVRAPRSRLPILGGVAAVAAAAVLFVVLRGHRGEERAAPQPSPPEPAVAAVASPPPQPQPTPPPVVHAPEPAPTPAPAPAPVAPQPPHVDAAPAMVSIDVTSVPAGAIVLRAGSAVGKTPYHERVRRDSPPMELTLRLAGYADAKVAVHTDSDVERSVKLDARRAPAPRAPVSDRDKSVNPF